MGPFKQDAEILYAGLMWGCIGPLTGDIGITQRLCKVNYRHIGFGASKKRGPYQNQYTTLYRGHEFEDFRI